MSRGFELRLHLYRIEVRTRSSEKGIAFACHHGPLKGSNIIVYYIPVIDQPLIVFLSNLATIHLVPPFIHILEMGLLDLHVVYNQNLCTDYRIQRRESEKNWSAEMTCQILASVTAGMALSTRRLRGWSPIVARLHPKPHEPSLTVGLNCTLAQALFACSNILFAWNHECICDCSCTGAWVSLILSLNVWRLHLPAQYLLICPASFLTRPECLFSLPSSIATPTTGPVIPIREHGVSSCDRFHTSPRTRPQPQPTSPSLSQ